MSEKENSLQILCKCSKVIKKRKYWFYKEIKGRLNPGNMLSLILECLVFQVLFREREVKIRETIALRHVVNWSFVCRLQEERVLRMLANRNTLKKEGEGRCKRLQRAVKWRAGPYFLPNRIYDQMKHDLLVGASNIHEKEDFMREA
jgi:hypothetical protein